MQLFYSPDISTENTEFSFDKTESRHIIKVLRKSEGDILAITNGCGLLFDAELILAHEKRCTVSIRKTTLIEKPWSYHLHIAIAPTKLMDRFEWFIEKATEIGIDEITPIICARSERKTIKMERLVKKMQAAAKQSLKYHFPKLNAPVPLARFLNKTAKGQKFIAHCDETHKKSFKSELNLNNPVTVLIGPEGDFSPSEIKQSLEHKYIPVSLGTSRLRTETAGVIAVHSVAFFNE